MNYRYLMVLCLPSALCLSLAAGEGNTASLAKPNVIIIYADDLGYGDVGCYGGRLSRTPNIDRIASINHCEEALRPIATEMHAAPPKPPHRPSGDDYRHARPKST